MSEETDYLKLYLVTDRDLAGGRSLAEVVERAVAGGVSAVQVREKSVGGKAFLRETVAIRDLLAGTGVRLFVNDRVDVALAAEADGVHVGQDDLPAAEVRRLIGPQMLLGVSVATPGEALAALADGADYLSVSAVSLTPTKPDADRAVGLEGIASIRRVVGNAPLIAIGGINASNAADVIRAGADGVAVVSAVMAATDPTAAAGALLEEVEAALGARRVG